MAEVEIYVYKSPWLADRLTEHCFERFVHSCEVQSVIEFLL